MLLQRFYFFLKKIIHKKEFGKKLNHKTVTLHGYCGVNIKYEFLSKTFNESNNMPVEKM